MTPRLHVGTVPSRRLHPRISNVRDLSVRYEGRDEDVRTRPPDISARGMFINTSQSFPEGAILNVRFKLALTGTEIQARGEVRYCHAGVGVGVEFMDIPQKFVKAIEKEIALAGVKAGKNGLKRGKSKRPKSGARRRARSARASARKFFAIR
jgi:hypothetical protein